MSILKRKTRWKIAQEYELRWWTNYNDTIEWYKIFSDEIIYKTSPYIKINKNTVILEIGSGAAGGITFLNSDYKYAIDPLEYFFCNNDSWSKLRDKNVKYFTGIGEDLPFNDNYFDLIIIDNVLDHCENPCEVLNEINRTIKYNGIIFFRQNVYNKWGYFLRLIMEIFMIDKGHPFTFTKHYLDENFEQRSWEIKYLEENSYFNTWIENIDNLSFKGIIQTFLFIIRNRTLFILKKTKLG